MDCFPCLRTLPIWFHPKSAGDFQISISSLDLFLKLQIPESNKLLNFSAWKLNITCSKWLLVIFPKPVPPSESHLSSWQLHNYAKSFGVILPLISLWYSSKSWPGNLIGSTCKINLSQFSTTSSTGSGVSQLDYCEQLLTCLCFQP